MANPPKPTKASIVTDVATVVSGVSKAISLAKLAWSLITSLRRK